MKQFFSSIYTVFGNFGVLLIAIGETLSNPDNINLAASITIYITALISIISLLMWLRKLWKAQKEDNTFIYKLYAFLTKRK